MTESHVLGIDLASGRWRDNGAAVLSFDADAHRWSGLRCTAVDWPSSNLTAAAIAKAIDDYARAEEIAAVALDGPQGWRDPETPVGTPGVGRRCEWLCRTQGKTGVEGKTYPQTQYAWIKFCIDVFDELLRLGHARLALGPAPLPPTGGYWIMECFPTWTWREAGMQPLPGKNRRPDTGPYWDRLRQAFVLPANATTIGHDDLQAVVAALVAAAAVGGPCVATSFGTPAFERPNTTGGSMRLEGLIWSAKPRAGIVESLDLGSPPISRQPLPGGEPAGQVFVRVTQKVIDQVNRQGETGEQIAIIGDGVRELIGLVTLRLDDSEYTLVKSDTYAMWRSHQTDATMPSFEELFARLADQPGEQRRVSHPRIGAARMTRSEVERFAGQLRYVRDDRSPPDNVRRGRFKAGWDDAAVRAQEYRDETLQVLTWHNLGYRFGREFGSRSPDEIEEAYWVLASLHQSWEDPATAFPEEVDESILTEGAVTRVTVNAYERNPEARARCLARHGRDCAICGFNFGQAYGLVAEGFIHVHHLRALSEVGGEYVVDPETDLRPVCPNCHAVIHLSRSRLTQ